MSFNFFSNVSYSVAAMSMLKLRFVGSAVGEATMDRIIGAISVGWISAPCRSVENVIIVRGLMVQFHLFVFPFWYNAKATETITTAIVIATTMVVMVVVGVCWKLRLT